MYGLINKAVRGLVLEQFGDDVWARIRGRAGVEEEDFLSMTSYDDAVTYDLVAAASAELGHPPRTFSRASASTGSATRPSRDTASCSIPRVAI